MTEDRLINYINEINYYLNRYIENIGDTVPERLLTSMKYSLFAGGKRLRPILALETARVFSNNIDHVIPLACGLEMIHTYSLIHDDLPAIDNDDYRRGKLTNHKVYGENMAILTGDALLNYAYEIMIGHTKTLNNPKLMHYLQALSEITTCAGTQGMITGQVVDILNDDGSVNKEELDFINRYKTAALIEASVRAGALVNNCDEVKLNYLTKYSRKIGLAFQIVDDILDVVGDPTKIGKSIGSDEKNKKSTYVNFYGLNKANQIVDELMKSALDYINLCEIHDSMLINLTYFICKRDY